MSAGACGDGSDGGSGGTGYSGGGGASTLTELAIKLDPDSTGGKEEELIEEVSCEEGSDDAACQALAELSPADLEPVAPDVACTELYGGPDTAALEGMIDGEEVDAELSRSNGCEIERFDAALPLLQALWPDYEPGASLQP